MTRSTAWLVIGLVTVGMGIAMHLPPLLRRP
jgi:hypothetical protein